MEALPALRILVVANLYPSARHPAFGTFVGARVAALRRAGQDVSVVAITDDRLHRGVAGKYLRLALGAFRTVAAARLLRRRFDIVEAHIAFPTGLIAWPVARLGGARLVLFCHGSDVTVLPWRSARRASLAGRLFRAADLVIANSRFTADIADRRLGPLRRPAVVLSPGIELAGNDGGRESVRDAGRDSRDPGSPPRIVFVGRLAPGKGLEVLLDALAELAAGGPRVTLTIVGDGPLRQPLQERVQVLGLTGTIDFAGALAPDAVRAIQRSATIAVVPSTADEGLGLVALEAMAQGTLVVATALGGLAETIRDGETGLIAAAGNSSALAAALRRGLAMADGVEGDGIRGRARAVAATHDVDRSVQVSIDAFRVLLDQPHRRTGHTI